MKDSLRNFDNIRHIYRSLQLLQANVFYIFGPLLVICSASFMLTSLFCNFVLIRYLPQLEIISKLQLLAWTVIAMLFWGSVLGFGGYIYSNGTKVIRSWKVSQNVNGLEGKLMRKFARSYVLHGGIPLNIYAIIYERVRAFRMGHPYEKFLVIRTILLIWVLAIGGSIPSLASYGFEADINGNGFGKCKKPIPTEQTRRIAYRVRFVYIYAMLFILVWLVVAVIVLVFKLISPSNLNTGNGNIALIAKFLSLLYYIYCILNPLIYLVLNESMSLQYVLGCDSLKSHFVRMFCQSSNAANGSQVGECRKENREIELMDISLFTTFAVSEENSSTNQVDKDIPNADAIDKVEVKVEFDGNPGVFV
ncbi:unnamed protein product [Orchesella dallaii]|uniref:G-protein coupled receptors family 1 profile domain-containing protein n=1 Tax=Orchesella dallaii TaxID=48710 RepID=A0ABP1RK16_9HEXA